MTNTTLPVGSDGFLRAILENPADDAPRLVFADWLEEHGQPERAAFIRAEWWEPLTAFRGARKAKTLAVSRVRSVLPKSYKARTSQLDGGPRSRRSRHLVPEEATAFGFSSSDVCFRFRHGFASSVLIHDRSFLKVAARLFATEPIESVCLTRAFLDDDELRGPWNDDSPHVRLWRHPRYGRTRSLPPVIYDRLDGHVATRTRDCRDCRAYLAAADAYWAVSRACVSWGREQAGLPPIPEQRPEPTP